MGTVNPNTLRESEKLTANKTRSVYKLSTSPRTGLNLQYSRKKSVRIYGIPESAEGEATREDTNEIVLKIATKIGANITSQDVSFSQRIGRRGRGSKPRPIIAKFVRKDCKSDMMRCKKKMRQMTEFQGVYINDDLMPSGVGSSTS